MIDSAVMTVIVPLGRKFSAARNSPMLRRSSLAGGVVGPSFWGFGAGAAPGFGAGAAGFGAGVEEPDAGFGAGAKEPTRASRASEKPGAEAAGFGAADSAGRAALEGSAAPRACPRLGREFVGRLVGGSGGALVGGLGGPRQLQIERRIGVEVCVGLLDGLALRLRRTGSARGCAHGGRDAGLVGFGSVLARPSRARSDPALPLSRIEPPPPHPGSYPLSPFDSLRADSR